MSKLAIESLKKTKDNLQARLEEQREALAYYEKEIEGCKRRVIEYGEQIEGLRSTIALLEKV